MPGTEPGPLVSIGIPTYNRAHCLPRSVKSVLRQGHTQIEVIVSDNASTDGTEALCRQYAASDQRVRYIRQERNLGPTPNFNTALAAARGEYFMWLADDDWLDPDYVARCLDALRGDPGVVTAGGRAALYAEHGGFLGQDIALNLVQATPQARVLAYYAQVTFNSLFYGLTKADVLRPIGLTNALAGDWKTVSALALRGKMVTIEGTRIHRRAAGTSSSFKSTLRTLRLPAYQGYFPRVLIAVNSSRDVCSDDAVAHLPLFARWGLAFRVFAILMLRYSWMRRFISHRVRAVLIAKCQ